MEGFDRFRRIGGDVAVGVEGVEAALTEDDVVDVPIDGDAFDVVLDERFGGGDEVLPGRQGNGDAGGIVDVVAVVEDDRGEGVLDAVDGLTDAVEGLAGGDELVEIAAAGQLLGEVGETDVALDEGAEAALLDVGEIRGADAAGLEGDEEFVVVVLVGGLDDVDRQRD